MSGTRKGVGFTHSPRKCRKPGCGTTCQGNNLFCRTDYYMLPIDMRNKLWRPLYGGRDHVNACLEYLDKQ